MPSFLSGYTFADFLRRLQCSPLSHMSLLYHQHVELFRGRPDMFTKAVLSVSWQRAVALLDAAYYAQTIAVDTYGGVLTRMYLHNEHVRRSGAGQVVDWKSAMHVFSEAILAHGNAVPTHMSVLVLRLLASHRQSSPAMKVLRLAQANGKLTKPMLVDAAHSCATEDSWSQALHLLMHLHKDDPSYLANAIQSLRPVGTNVWTAHVAEHAALPDAATRPNAVQQHVLCVLNDVVSSVPWEVALNNELCYSYLGHLAASTTLATETKAQALSKAIRQLPWHATVALLVKYTEPNLLDDMEWERLSLVLPCPKSEKLHKIRAKEGAGKSHHKGKLKKLKKAEKGSVENTGSAKKAHEEGCFEVEAQAQLSATTLSHQDAKLPIAVSEPDGPDDLLANPRRAWDFVVRHFFFSSRSLRCPPSVLAALIAALVAKLPNAETAMEFVHAADAFGHPAKASETSTKTGILATVNSHPVVRLALMRKCCESSNGWKVAVQLLLMSPSNSFEGTPTDLLSPIVLQLRAARQVSLAVRLLQEYIVPTHGKLTLGALEALFECILSHNRAVHMTLLSMGRDRMPTSIKSSLESTARELEKNSLITKKAMERLNFQVVHWESVLRWATDLLAPPFENRIAENSTGASRGAVSRRPVAIVPTEIPFSGRMLSLLLSICVDAGSPQGALYVMGYARKVNKIELAFSEEVRALLYCMMYDRPYEAEALVIHAEKKHGNVATAPLRRLLTIAQSSMQRKSYAS